MKNFSLKGEEYKLEKISHLKHQLDLIGSIDPEITKEYPQIKDRYEFLTSQSEDLIKTIKSLNKIIQELDEKIKAQFEEKFKQINQKFDRYFQIIFGGGQAKINLQKSNQPNEEDDLEETKESNEINILANPPGKKIKNIEMLSGGEKALTSLALICSIISINKPPFVVLDEVDAALDQENSFRFAKILHELKQNTQFIVITHNQQTIEISDILYGVTMGSDGISKLVSLKLE
jgi:chromosome segregation protein